MFGNGSGFVWYGGAQQEQVVQGALADHVEAGLVTMHRRSGIAEHQAAGQKAVAQGILGRTELGGGGERALGASAVGTGGCDSS